MLGTTCSTTPITFEWLTFPASPQMAVTSSLLSEAAGYGKIAAYTQTATDGILSFAHGSKNYSHSSAGTIDYGLAFKNIGYGSQWWRGKFTNGDTDTLCAAGWAIYLYYAEN
jgi:hypothetical protein